MRNAKKLIPGILSVLLLLYIAGCSKTDIEKLTTNPDDTKGASAGPEVLSVEPANNSQVPVNFIPSVNFNKAINTASVTSSTLTVSMESNPISGSVYCNGTTASFTPATAFLPNKTYKITATTGIQDAAGNPMAADYTWSFSTTPVTDGTPPTILAVSPVANAVSIATNSAINATFSESISSQSVTTSSFFLKQGSNIVSGNLSVSNNVVTFTPAAPLLANTLYSGTVTSGVKDMAGNALASNYSWSFTTAATADIIPPTVTSVSPLANATSVDVTGKPSITFSESVNASTVNATSFSLKQGSSVISGNVAVSGATATFTPASSLVAGTVYTVTATTGIKDLAGNALASNYSWSFTTAAAPSGKSFSADVVPILNQCNTCHTHGWTPSPTASVFYTNLVSKGYVNPTAPTSGKIYVKVSGGHPSSTITSVQKNTILTWINEGSKNN
jgi:hypothetical protein